MSDNMNPTQAQAWSRRGVRHAGLRDLLEFSALANLGDNAKLWLILGHTADGVSEEHIESCVSLILKSEICDEICKKLVEELGLSAEIVSVLYGVAKARAIAPKLIDHIESGIPWVVELIVGAVRTPNGFSYWSSHKNASRFSPQVVLMRCDDPLGMSSAGSLTRRGDQRIEIECSDLDRIASPADLIMPNFIALTHLPGA